MAGIPLWEKVRPTIRANPYARGVAALLMAGLFVVPFVLSNYETYLVGWILSLAIVGLAYNVLLGYTGMISFGHAAFFGTGAYTAALLTNHTSVQSVILILALALLVSTVLAAIVGFLTIRHSEIYYALLTLAIAQVLYALVVNNYEIMRGTDGMPVGRPHFLGIGFEELASLAYIAEFFCYIVALSFIATVIVLWRVVNSPFGLTLMTIRDNEKRASSLGIPVRRYKFYAMLISGAFTGYGGVLYGILQQRVTPELLYWTFSGDILFFTVLGGPSTFAGPIVGAGLFVLIQRYALALISDYWRFAMGLIIFVIVLTVRDDGVWGGLKRLAEYARRQVR